MQKLIWKTEKRRLGDLVPAEKNPNVNERVDDIKKSIRRDGYVEIIAINTDGKIVAGSHRWKAMMEMGIADREIDVRVPNRTLTQEEFNRYLIASNALKGGWNFDILRDLDPEFLRDSFLSDEDLANIWDGQLEVENDKWDEEKEIAKIKKPRSRVGEIYALGKHRLAVGDATDPAVLKRLFGKERASMIYSDPVYNLNFPYRKGLGGRQDYGAEVHDRRTKEEYRTFLKKSMESALAVATPDCHVFYWNDQSQIGLVQDLFDELRLTNRRVCLWIKNGQNPTPGVAFSKCYEPCIYSTRGRPYLAKRAENLNEVMNQELRSGNALIDDILDMLDIWLVKRLPGNEYIHATAKPPNLHEKAMRRCTRPGDIILDSFSGSGSTLVAAHQLKRRAFVVELEPLFADLTIVRYERLTHEKAKRVN